jgi:spermidine dehydrogenase
MKLSDKKLGMDQKIDRRDFLNGVSIGVVGSILGPSLVSSAQSKSNFAQDQDGYYPPALMGIRGDHTGSFEASHTVRDGRNMNGKDTEEEYDLVVVGGGISGLASAWFYRQSVGPDAKILILDNHDDFGGHAKRNEYTLDGRNIIVNGGTLNVEQPTNYSNVARGLLRELGINLEAYQEKTKEMVSYYRNHGYDGATFFDKETFGDEGLVSKPREQEWTDFFDNTPLSKTAKRDLKRLHEEKVTASGFEGMSDDEKKVKLASTSYNDYLTEHLNLDPSVLPFFQARTHFRHYMGPEQVPALFCWQMDTYPGFKNLELRPTAKISPLHHIGGSQHGREHEYRESSIYFPDGNATIARMIVRHLIPEAIPGDDLDDLISSRVDYAKLDRQDNPSRVRLNSSVINVKHLGEIETAKKVEITYIREGGPYKVTAKNCVLACWHMVIPYLCREFNATQRGAMKYGIKAPRVYTNVLLRNGKPFEKLGVSSIHAPGEFHSSTSLHMPLSVGDYKAPIDPEEPVIVKMHRAPCKPGADRSTQLKTGRTELFNMSFETFERNIREQLTKMLAGTGFDAARDIAGITVNRWPHGNAYAYNTLSDPPHWALYPSDDRPCVIARQPLGRISIANSDASASPFTDAAINEAHRAVREVLLDRNLMWKS